MEAKAINIPSMSDPTTLRHRLIRMVRYPLGLIKRALFHRGSGKTVPESVVGYDRHLTMEIRGRALLLYLSYPFANEDRERVGYRRPEGVMSLEIAKSLNELGYLVDIVDWKDCEFIPTFNYDVLVGMGPHYDRLCELLPETTLKVYFGTGASRHYENQRERARTQSLLERRGLWVEPRGLPPTRCAEVSDAVIALGSNEHVIETWKSSAKLVLAVNNIASPAHPLPNLTFKEFLVTRTRFLWFGSVYPVLRGLDLVLEAFQRLPDLELFVCAPLHSATDRDFVRAYRKELFHSPNIHTLGWIDLRSEDFLSLAAGCAFMITATCTEGMSGSVLNCMRAGLIPVVTNSAGVDVSGCGLLLEDETVGGIATRLDEASRLSEIECFRLASESVRRGSELYTLENFGKSMSEHLKLLLDG